MNVLNVSKNNNITSFTGAGNKPGVLARAMLKIIPSWTLRDKSALSELEVNAGKKCLADKISDFCDWSNKPHVNRGLMGLFAIFTQPYIDKHNKKVDEDTANISAIRTGSKILVGTGVGIAVRAGCYKLMTYLTKEGGLLYPKAPPKGFNIGNHRSGIANFAGLIVMLFTNSLIDVPLTNILAKWGVKKYNTHKNNSQNPAEGGTPNQNAGEINPSVLRPTIPGGYPPMMIPTFNHQGNGNPIQKKPEFLNTERRV